MQRFGKNILNTSYRATIGINYLSGSTIGINQLSQSTFLRTFNSTPIVKCVRPATPMAISKNPCKMASCANFKTCNNKKIIGLAKHSESLEDYLIYVSDPLNPGKYMYLIPVPHDFNIGLHQHYKGQKYLVLGIAKDKLTQIEYVIYVCLYDNQLAHMWARPKDMFMEDIIQDGVLIPRFKYIGAKSNI